MNTDNSRIERSGPTPEPFPPPEAAQRDAVQASAAEALESAAAFPDDLARSPPLSQMARRVGAPTPDSRRIEQLRQGSIGPNPTRSHSLDLSRASRTPEGEPTYRGAASRVRTLEGKTVDFEKGKKLGSGAESTAYEAHVRESGRVHQRAFVEVGTYYDLKEQQGRLAELKSLHTEVNSRAAIGVKVHGLSTVADPARGTYAVGVLMDKGTPIFGDHGIPKEERVAFCEKFLAGIREMHASGITHGDIKVSIEREGDEAKDTSNPNSADLHVI